MKGATTAAGMLEADVTLSFANLGVVAAAQMRQLLLQVSAGQVIPAVIPTVERIESPASWPAQAGHPRLCARHGADLGGGSPLRADWPEPLAEGNCAAVRRVGRKPKAKLGADEQTSDTRPVRWGNPAVDGNAQRPSGHAHR